MKAIFDHEQQTFTSPDKFLVWDSSPSHSQLLLRASYNPQVEASENTDILFKGVFFMRIPTIFWGLELSVSPTDVAESVFKELGWEPDSVHRRVGRSLIFQIKTKGRTYYIGAAGWKVEKNKLRPNETSLDLPHLT